MNNILNFKSTSVQLISFLVVLMLSLSLVVHMAAGYSALAILLVSLLGLWVLRKEQSSAWTQWEKWWIFSILLFFGLIVLDVLMGYGDVSVLDSPSRLILAIPVFIYIRKVGLDVDSIWVGSAIGSVLAGVYAYYQHIILGSDMAGGFTSHIYFGQIALILTLFSFIGLLMVLIYAFIISILVSVLSYSKKNESLTS
jgi:O-antigen ligase